MQLFVKSFTGPTLSLRLEPASSLGDLRAIVEERTGVPRVQQRLLSQGHRLELSDDELPLDILGLESDSTVRLLLRLPGGGPGNGEMVLTVKVMGGRLIRVTLPHSSKTTVGDLQGKLRASEGLDASSYELMYSGQRLESTRTLLSYQIGSEASLDVVILPATGTPTPSAAMAIPMVPKNRCTVLGCGERIAKIVGECRYCGHGYCSRHRLPESHQCDNMQGCRQQSYEKNSSKLLGEKCVADKV